MVSMLIVIGISAAIVAIGGSIGYFFWLYTRPKKETWKAIIYEASESTRSEDGLTLHDLTPYGKDIIEKIEHEEGGTIYRLKKINKPLPGVDGNIVEYWGKENKNIYVLKQNDTYTTLKRGYDDKKGLVFQPMPHSKVNLIKSEIILRKNRLKKEKDILEAITPWIIFGIAMITLVALVYIITEGYIKISENLRYASESMADSLDRVREYQINQSQTIVQLGKQPAQTPSYPLVEGG